MTKIPEVETEELPAEYQHLLANNAVGELSLFKTLANNPEVLQSYMRWGTVLWENSGLTEQEVELVILAVARFLNSRYEWHQHVQLARAAGLTDESILAIANGNHDQLTPSQQTLARYAEEFLDGEVTSELSEQIRRHWDDETLVGLTLLCSHYLATARTIDALSIEPEDSFVGWQLESDS